MGPFEKPIEALNKVFALDLNEQLREACTRTIDESITPEERREFYSQELSNISNDTLASDVEWSSLRLQQN